MPNLSEDDRKLAAQLWDEIFDLETPNLFVLSRTHMEDAPNSVHDAIVEAYYALTAQRQVPSPSNNPFRPQRICEDSVRK